MIFRPIRGYLSDSLKDKKEITTIKELEELIDSFEFEHPLIINFHCQGYDSRVSSYVWIVCCKMKGYQDPQAAGYLHDNPNKLL